MINNFHNFPQGWEVKTLGEVGKVVSGGTPSTSNKDNFDGEIAWITPADLSGYKEKYISKGKRNLSEQGLKNSSARLLPPNSILFSSRAPIGYVAIASNTLCTNQGFKNLIPNDDVSSEYIYHFLLYSKRLAESVASGTTFKEISATNFSKLPIPLPPLATQKLIVEKLENAFAHIDEAVRHLKSVQTNIPRLKSSLLHCAFSGKLTESQNQSHKVQTLKKRVVGEEGETLPFEPLHPLIKTEIPQGWEVKTLGECLEYEQPTKYIVKNTQYSNEYEIPVLTAGKSFLLGYTNDTENIFTQTPVIIFDDFTTDSKFVDFHFKVKSSAMKILHATKIADIKFVFYFMQIIQHRSDTHKRYWISEYAKFLIPLPPLETQKQIVRILESKFAHLEKLAQFVNESLENLQKLKSSLLNQAFKGELIC